MNKPVITREQARFIGDLEENKPLGKDVFDFIYKLSKCEMPYSKQVNTINDEQIEVAKLMRAFLDGYEVEPVIKVGDWGKFEHRGETIITRILDIDYEGEFFKVDAEFPGLRYPTVPFWRMKQPIETEIYKERERRFWAEHGREVWELREGDVLGFNGKTFVVDAVESRLFHPIVHYKNDSWNLLENEKKHNVVCFAHQRLDREVAE